ncbi:MAG: hypothetical protein IANPNBLG_00170 [Bryobacteraceae bacterium]|nr:hypothetical protein [Bryobacteraceae bacterium]
MPHRRVEGAPAVLVPPRPRHRIVLRRFVRIHGMPHQQLLGILRWPLRQNAVQPTAYMKRPDPLQNRIPRRSDHRNIRARLVAKMRVSIPAPTRRRAERLRSPGVPARQRAIRRVPEGVRSGAEPENRLPRPDIGVNVRQLFLGQLPPSQIENRHIRAPQCFKTRYVLLPVLVRHGLEHRTPHSVMLLQFARHHRQRELAAVLMISTHENHMRLPRRPQ